MIADRPIRPEDAHVIVLGMLPPPVTGASKNTQLLVDDLIKRGIPTAAISTAPNITKTALGRSAAYHISRIKRFLSNISAILDGGESASRRPILYLVPDGGLGVFYSAMYCKIARSRFSHLFVHHRSFGYIDQPNRWMKMICRSFNNDITHIFLSNGMKHKFQTFYSRQDSLVIGNSHYVKPLSTNKPGNELILGHLGNLSEQKGFYECISTFLALRKKRLPVRLILSGAAQEGQISDDLQSLLREYPNEVEYLGPLYGAEKDEFYRRVHLFLFPTKWTQEAQPNVIYEAFAGGASVIAFGRGSIPEMVPPDLGLVVEPNADFVELAASYAAEFWNNPTQRPSLARFHAEIEREGKLAKAQYESLIERLSQ